jgi:hypothetical protein
MKTNIRTHNKSYVLDIFILIYSIIPALFIMLFTLSWVNSSIDTALLLFQVSLMMIFTLMTISIPQLNTTISRTMIMWVFILNVWLGLTIITELREPKFGIDNWFFRNIRDITFLVVSYFIIKIPIIDKFLTKFKHNW